MGARKNMRHQHRVRSSDYHALRKGYNNLQRKLKIFGKTAQRDHFELLSQYTELRYNPLVNFLM